MYSNIFLFLFLHRIIITNEEDHIFSSFSATTTITTTIIIIIVPAPVFFFFSTSFYYLTTYNNYYCLFSFFCLMPLQSVSERHGLSTACCLAHYFKYYSLLKLDRHTDAQDTRKNKGQSIEKYNIVDFCKSFGGNYRTTLGKWGAAFCTFFSSLCFMAVA